MSEGATNGGGTQGSGNAGSTLSSASAGSPPSAGNGGSSGAGNAGSSTGTAQAGGGGTAAGNGTQGTGQSPGWRDSFPDDLKNAPTLSKFSDTQNLAKAYLELEKKIGQKGIIKPSVNDSPEAFKSFYEALGVPSADKYEIGKIEGVQYPEKSVEFAKATGAELGILPEQMTKLLQAYAKFEGESITESKKQSDLVQQERLSGLKKEWGEAYDTNLQKGLFAFEQVAELAGLKKEDATKWLNSGAGNDVMFIKLMGAASKLLGEDKLREGGISDGRLTTGEVENKIAVVQAQLFAMKPTDGRYAGLKSQYESLWKQKTGGR